ncbi:MlaD family protein [Nocardia sp. XZ_19_385]|uniref:MlaD family protein n=1 Tax=Nocardia sp. XZ_19_385 TaxID=2769488 RepID=UPI00188F0162|nr:MlaD family protein [Nocardia sp. XZ_19_385]
MLQRLFASRAFLSLTTLAVLAAVVVAGFHLARPQPPMRTYCALMSDSIGLYTGGNVTIRGIPSGTVTRIAPAGTGVRVDFELPADEKLPPDVGATTVSDTLVANRRLAIIGNRPAAGPGWDAGQCISKTITPQSLSQTFSAIAKLADELNGANDPTRQRGLAEGLAAVNAATDGRGQQINDLVHALGSALKSPDAGIGHLGRLLDALAALARSAANGWGEVETVLTGLPSGLHAANTMAVPPITQVLTDIGDVLPMLNDLTLMFGGRALRELDAADPALLLAGAGIGSLLEVIRMTPALAAAFSNSVDSVSGRAALDYAPARVAIPAESAAQVCAAVNAVAPGRCADPGDGLVHVQLAQLILGQVGAR